MSSSEVTGNDWIERTVESIKRDEEEQRLRHENALLEAALIEEYASPFWTYQASSIERAVKDFNERFSDEPKRRFHFCLNNPDEITVANECSGFPRLEAKFDAERHVMEYKHSWSKRSSHRFSLHIAVRHGLVCWMQLGKKLSAEKATEILLKPIFNPER
jgi:hypothetical protein